MTLEQRIMAELKTAMLAKDEKTVRSLRAVKAAILVAKTAGGASGQVSEEEETKILQKMVKQRKDSLEIFRQQNREDLASKELEEIEVIEKFLPKQMEEQELREYIQGVISKTGAAGPGDLGKVMGIASKELAGKADGKTISTIARELLNQ